MRPSANACIAVPGKEAVTGTRPEKRGSNADLPKPRLVRHDAYACHHLRYRRHSRGPVAVGPASRNPRTPNGKPNLNAPTPHTSDGKPDLSGIWKADTMRYNDNLLPEGTEAPMLPWAAELYKHRVATHGYDRPMTYCLPHGVPDNMTVAGLPFKMIQTPRATVVLFEEFHVYRQIHTDGRPLPVDPDPAWYGYSIGRWEGDAFVAQTAGFKGVVGDNSREGSWLDNNGHPHTDALQLTERYHRTNLGTWKCR